MEDFDVKYVQRIVQGVPTNAPFKSFMLEGDRVFVGVADGFKTFLAEVVRMRRNNLVLTVF